MQRPNIGIIGTGKVGTTLALRLHRTGYRVMAVFNRTKSTASRIIDETGCELAESTEQVLQRADLTFLAVSDDAISTVIPELGLRYLSNRAVVHTSGAKSMRVLTTLADADAMIGSFHPAVPFADVDTAIEALTGAAFAIEYQDESLGQWLKQIVEDLEGRVVIIPPEQKATYHAAMVFASNFVVTLAHTASDMLKSIGVDEQDVKRLLLPLMNHTLDNLEGQNIADALTGPAVRGDVETIQGHLQALEGDKTTKAAYLALLRLTMPILAERGLPQNTLAEFKNLTNETEERYETLNT